MVRSATGDSRGPLGSLVLDRRGLLMAFGASTVAGLVACSDSNGSSSSATQATEPSTASTSPAPSPDTDSPEPTPSEEETSSTEAEVDFSDVEDALGDQEPTEWGLEVTGTITHINADQDQAVLTLDACGGPGGSGYDEELITLLRATSTPATLFINQRWAQENPQITAELIEDPLFEVANHGTLHLPLSVSGQEAYGITGTANLAEAFEEIQQNQQYFGEQYGLDMQWFRPGTAYADDVSASMAQMLNTPLVGFSINADAGATFTAGEVQQAMAGAVPGDICIGHFNQPGSGTFEGLRIALTEAEQRGLTWVTLAEATPA